VFYLSAVCDIPFFEHLRVDARFFDRWGWRIAGGDWLGSSTFFLAPAYAYFLAVVYSIFGHSLMAVHLVQIVLGSASCVLLFIAGRRYFHSRIAVIAGLMLALYPPAIFFDGIIHKACLAMFLTCALLACLSKKREATSIRRALMVGFLLGSLALTRENMLVLIVVIPLWYLLGTQNTSRRSRWFQAGSVIVAASALLVPVAARNAYWGGSFALATTNLGSNFFIGNNPDANGLYQSFDTARQEPEYEQADAIRRAEQIVGRRLSSGEASDYWLKRGISWVTGNPVAWLKLTARRALLCWHRFEIPDTQDIYAYGEWCPLFGWSLFFWHFGVLAPTALAGIVFNWHRRRACWVLLAFLVAVTLSISLFFVFARFRYPLVAVLVLFAASAIDVVVFSIRAVRKGTLIACAAVFLMSAIAFNVPVLPENAYRSNAFVNLASITQETGNLDKAHRFLSRAIALYERNALAHYQLGRLYEQVGRVDDAISSFQVALAIDDSADAFHLSLADALRRRGRTRESVVHYEDTLRLNPRDFATRKKLIEVLKSLNDDAAATKQENLLDMLLAGKTVANATETETPTTLAQRVQQARTAFDVGNLERAVVLFRQILRERPNDPVLHYELATVMVAAARPSDALVHFRRAIELKPDYAAAHSDFGRELANEGKFAQAITQYRAAIEGDPTLLVAHYNLATALAATGRLEEAIDSMTRFQRLAQRANRPDLVSRAKDRLRQLKKEQSP